MSVTDLNRRHLGLIAFYSTRYAVRGGAGLMFLLLVLITGLLIAHLVITPTEHFPGGLASHESQAMLGQIIGWAIGEPGGGFGDPDAALGTWTRHLLLDKPAALAAIFLVLLFAAPFLCAAGGFNLYSGDIGSRGLRYHLLRTERANIFFGRFAGNVLYSWATMFFLILVVTLYLGLKTRHYETSALVGFSIRGVAALCVVTLPYLALCAWISSAMGSAFGSLVICSLVVGGVPLAAVIGRTTSKLDQVAYVKWLLPWGIQDRLFHHETWQVAFAALACLGYAAVFLGLGYRHFAKRDL